MDEVALPDGRRSRAQADVAAEVHRFYSDLYSEPTIRVEEHRALLQAYQHTMDPAKLADLNRPITLDEVRALISRAPQNKAAGPDGLPGDVYRRFADLIAPILLKVFNEIDHRRKIPTSFRQFVVVLASTL